MTARHEAPARRHREDADGKILAVVDACDGVLQREVTHLAFEPGAVYDHRALAGRQHCDDLSQHGVVEPERPDLGRS